MTDERLIADVTQAIRDADNSFEHEVGSSPEAEDRRWLGVMARAAVAVFEKEHTPTDDEPVAYGIYARVTGNLKYVQVMDEREVEEQSEFYDVVPLFRRSEPQGEPSDAIPDDDQIAADNADWHTEYREPRPEPSDAEVLAALNAYYGGKPPVSDAFKDSMSMNMRAALRAASGVGGEGR